MSDKVVHIGPQTIFTREFSPVGIKIMAYRRPHEIGHLYLYVLKNDLHDEPFGFIEDVFVNEDFRNDGYGRRLVQIAVELAKDRGCYKLVLTTSKDWLVHWYESLGFCVQGTELRMDF